MNRKTEWISVEERLPETDSMVFVHFELGYPSVVSYCENGFLAWDDIYGEYNIMCNPTHWMPLPDPPTEG